jgi:hypothetical protein
MAEPVSAAVRSRNPGPKETVARARVTISRKGDHYLVVAAEAIGKGETILNAEGVLSPVPSRFSIQIASDQHLEPGPGGDPVAMERYQWRFLNHSCDPNAYLRCRALVALRPIAAGEEVTFDYHTTEWDMASPFACLCGAPRCVGQVRGFRHLDGKRKRELRPWLAEHLRERG